MKSPIRPVDIRPYAPEDLPLLERLLGDPAMTTHLGGPETPEAIRARHERYLEFDEAGGELFTVVVGAERVAAGWVGYWESESDGERVWECGWHVLPEFQRASVAREAMRRMLVGVRARETHRYLHAYPSVANEPSNRLCARLGFELLGEKQVEYPKGHQMLSNDWRLDLAESPSGH